MSKTEQTTVAPSRQQKVLDLLEEEERTWYQLRALTKINDDNLGFTLMELLDLRKIWTVRRSGVRVYGIERRTDLAPRYAHERRRAGDSHI